MPDEKACASRIKHVGMEPVSGEVTVVYCFADRAQAERFHSSCITLMAKGEGVEMEAVRATKPKPIGDKKEKKE